MADLLAKLLWASWMHEQCEHLTRTKLSALPGRD
jgi:hypothetical protein